MLEGIAHPQPLSLTLDVAAPESYPLADPWTHRSHPTRKTPPPTSATRASFLLFLPFFPFSFFAARWRGTSQGRIRMEWTPPRRCIPSFFPRTTRAPVLGGMDDGCAFSFSSFFFPPLFRTSQWRRASNNVWIILTLRCKLYFFRERERERGVFGGINNSLIWYLWDWNYKSETMESIIR